MDFALCVHQNIAMTCPQCRGRAPAAPAAVSGFGLPTTTAVPRPTQQAPADDSIETLYERTKNPNQRFEIIMGSAIDQLTTKAERKVEATSDRDVRQHNAFWRQINEPTTVSDHERQRRAAEDESA